MPEQKPLRLVLQRIPVASTAAEQHCFAHQLLEQMLQEQGIAPPYTLQKGLHGKPFLVQHPDIQINLSHCKGAVLCGIGGMPLGVDVEAHRSVQERVMRRVLTEAEQQAVLQAEQPAVQFMRFWTWKESFVKAIGIGISYPMQQIFFSQLQPIQPAAAVCEVQEKGSTVCVPMAEYAADGTGIGYRFFQCILAGEWVVSACVQGRHPHIV